jgi:hypothetical protein
MTTLAILKDEKIGAPSLPLRQRNRGSMLPAGRRCQSQGNRRQARASG